MKGHSHAHATDVQNPKGAIRADRPGPRRPGRNPQHGRRRLNGQPLRAASGHSQSAVKPTIVLEHGAWADGSSWDGVVTLLQKDGYTVDVPPNPLRGPDSDSAYLASYLATVPGPVVLVGHSYGGFVTTNAATGDKNVKALVYVDAYLPAQGDTINSLTAQFPGSQITPAALNFVPSPGGVTDVYIKPSLFRSILANDLPAEPGGRARRYPAADRGQPR